MCGVQSTEEVKEKEDGKGKRMKYLTGGKVEMILCHHHLEGEKG